MMHSRQGLLDLGADSRRSLLAVHRQFPTLENEASLIAQHQLQLGATNLNAEHHAKEIVTIQPGSKDPDGDFGGSRQEPFDFRVELD